MTDNLLDTWQDIPLADRTAAIIPDGCRDLIMRCVPGKRPFWFISKLQDYTCAVPIKAGAIMTGFRLQPGVFMDEARLLASVQHRHLDAADIRCRIAEFGRQSPLVVAALDCLASDVGSVANAARQLGLSQRSLQRSLIAQTGRPPVYWLMLARVRKSARAALGTAPLAQIAADQGYADQAHMSRAFKRWLGTTPTELRRDRQRRDQLQAAGYA